MPSSKTGVNCVNRRSDRRPCWLLCAPSRLRLQSTMRNLDTGAGSREVLTSKQDTRGISYDFFGETRFPNVLQTRQTVGRDGVRKRLTRLVVKVGFSTQPYLAVHHGLTFMASLTYSKGPSMDTRYFSRTSLARTLNPVPGNQSGRCCTVHDFVSCLGAAFGSLDTHI